MNFDDATVLSVAAGNQNAVQLTARPTIVVISDLVEGCCFADAIPPSSRKAEQTWRRLQSAHTPWPEIDVAAERRRLVVDGGYLERLPLACIKAGLVDHAEIWHHHTSNNGGSFYRQSPLLARRSFRVRDCVPPFASDDMLGFVKTFGAPHILCVLGLGVNREILDACGNSVRVYNSIDAPALRVPEQVSAAFDLVLTGAQWQSDVVTARHPNVATIIMPIGPEFAAAEMFRPLNVRKDFDLIYVAAAQPYKRHDILFDALANLPRSIRTLCVFGYGELAEDLRKQARIAGLNIEFVGPPGVSFEEVNILMNRSKIGLVCGVDDGAPAVLTEYMLAGLPVLANAELSCGRQFIIPRTGVTANASEFAGVIVDMLQRLEEFSPRQAVMERWTWPHTVKRFAAAVETLRNGKMV